MLTEAILGAAAEAVFGYLLQESLIADRALSWFGRDSQRLAFQTCLVRVYTTWAPQHRDWTPALFDQHFLTRGAVPVLARSLLRTPPPSGSDLAAAWADQVTLSAELRDERVNELTPIAAEFLGLLDGELRARPEFQPLFDSRALDSINETAQATTAHLEALRMELLQALRTANSVVIEGDMKGSVIVVGTGNVVGQVDLELTQALRELTRRFEGSSVSSAIRDYTRYIEEKTRDFVGRQFVFDAIEAFIRKSPRGYYFVRGDPGIGKTALAAQLVKTHGYVHHFNIRGDGINRNDIFLKNVCAQLIVAYDLNYDVLPPEATHDGGFFNRLLGEISDQLPPDERAILIVDALDEVEAPGTSSTTNLLYLPTILPPKIYIIATTRNVPIQLRIEVEQDALTIEQDAEGNIADIRLYVEQSVTRPGIQTYIAAQQIDDQAFVDHLVEKSQGNFMYLRYVLPEIEQGAYRDLELAALPKGLQNYYEDHWHRMRGQGGDEEAWFEYKLPIIMALTVVKEPVSTNLIADFSGVQSRARINRVLHDWHQFLYEQTVEYEGQLQRRYRIYHASFHDFIARLEEVEGEHVDRIAANKKIADVLWSEMFGEGG